MKKKKEKKRHKLARVPGKKELFEGGPQCSRYEDPPCALPSLSTV